MIMKTGLLRLAAIVAFLSSLWISKNVSAEGAASYREVLETALHFGMLPTCRQLSAHPEWTMRVLPRQSCDDCGYVSFGTADGKQFYILVKWACLTSNGMWVCCHCKEDGSNKLLRIEFTRSVPKVEGYECPSCK